MTTTDTTPTSKLTSRQRIRRAMRGQPHDRIPRDDHFWKETIARWRREGLQGDNQTLREMLQSDFVQVSWAWPKPFPGRHDGIDQDEHTQTFIDELGNTVRMHKQRSGTPEHVAFGCTDVEQWRADYRPRLVANRQAFDEEGAIAQARRAERQQRWLHLSGIGPATGVHQQIGDEAAMIGSLDDPEWLIDMAAVYTDAILAIFERQLKAIGGSADGMWICDDMGYNRGPFFSPEVYRQIYQPQHRRMVDWAHTHGMDAILHTDGDVRVLMEGIVEAGFDCMQPLEAKAGMDVRTLSGQYADQLTFFGNIDAMVLGSNDREKIEHEITTKLAAGMAQRRYIYHSDHTVPPDVSWPTYQFVIELLDRHGNYAG